MQKWRSYQGIPARERYSTRGLGFLSLRAPEGMDLEQFSVEEGTPSEPPWREIGSRRRGRRIWGRGKVIRMLFLGQCFCSLFRTTADLFFSTGLDRRAGAWQ